jgi:hypothetical protein
MMLSSKDMQISLSLSLSFCLFSQS